MDSNQTMLNDLTLVAYMEDEKRRAQQNQSQPRQDSLLDTIGKIALAAGAAAGTIAALNPGARRSLRQGFADIVRPGQTKTGATTDLSAVDVASVRRAAAPQTPPPSRPAPTSTAERLANVEQITREARAERPQGIRVSDLSAYSGTRPELTGQRTDLPQGRTPGTFKEFSQDVAAAQAAAYRKGVYEAIAAKAPEDLPTVYRPKGGLQDVVDQEGASVLITDPRTGQMFMRGQSPKSFNETYVSLRPALTGQRTDLPQTNTPSTFKQFSQDIADQSDFAQSYLRNQGYTQADSLVDQQEASALTQVDQILNAVNSAEDQQTGRVKLAFQRNEDENLAAIELAEDRVDARLAALAQTSPEFASAIEVDAAINTVAAQRPDGMPVDQAEGLNVLDLRNKESIRIAPRSLSQEENESSIFREAAQYLRGLEVDADFDYSAENKRQAAQVQDRIQKAQMLKNEAERVLAEIHGKTQTQPSQLSPQEFAKAFNQKYKEELNPALSLVDNARQRAELRAAQSESLSEDIESLLYGKPSEIESTMRGKALRGGKPNVVGDVIYQDESGTYASADTGLKTRQAQGEQFAERARRLNKLSSASDEDLTHLVLQGQQARASNQPISQIDSDTYRFASQVLRGRALKNPEPTQLQLDALDRARASIASSQRVIQGMRNQKPTLAPGPQQDVARAMETIRRGMAVEPSEAIPQYPSVQQLRTGYVSDEEIGPILGAADVYTGAAAEAAGPVIFTGKSKANTVLATPPITGSVRTSTGRYLTQDNPDVLGTVYNVAGTPANRAISAQIEQNAQDFLQDAIAGGLQQKTPRVAEPYRTPGTYGVKQFNLLTPPLTEKGLSQNQLGLPGLEASQRTGYAQYQPGRSVPVPRSPFIGEMAGGTVVVVPPTAESTRRDMGTPSRYMDLTRRGEKAKYFSTYPQETFVTEMEPAPIGPLTQSPGLSRIGGMTKQTVRGAGEGVYVTQLTPQGQKIAYPRMAKSVTVPGYGTSVVTNIPRYGINPGAEDWREDLMRSEYRRGGPIRTYQG